MKTARARAARFSGGPWIYFNALPEPVRLRLADCLHGRAEPVPLLRQQNWTMQDWVLLLLIGLGGGAFAGWMGLEDSLLTQTARELAVWPATALILTALIGIAGVRAVRKAIPCPQGRFVFAGDMVEVKGERLRIRSLQTLQGIRIVHSRSKGIHISSDVILDFSGETVSFGTSREGAGPLSAALQRARMALAQAAARGDYATLARLDPLLDLKLAGDWESYGIRPRRLRKRELQEESLARPVPWPCGSRRQALAAGTLASMLAGPVFTGIVNSARDDAQYAKAVREHTIAAYETYLERGRAHKEEIRSLLGTLGFEEAMRLRSVSRLRACISSRPDHQKVPAARHLMHELYQEARDQLTKNPKPDSAAFLSRLITFLEAQGSPALRVRFAAPPTALISSLDRLQAPAGTVIAPFGDSFSASAWSKREGAIISALNAGLHKILPADIVALQSGPPLFDARAPAMSEASLEIRYTIAGTGDFYVCKDGGGTALLPGVPGLQTKKCYAGFVVEFDITARIPGDDSPCHFQLSVAPPLDFRIVGQTERFHAPSKWGNMSSPSDESIYAAMAAEALKKLEKQLTLVLFGAPGDRQHRRSDAEKSPWWLSNPLRK